MQKTLTEKDFIDEEEKHKRLTAERKKRDAESIAIGGMLFRLTELEAAPIKFDEKLRHSTVDHVTVYNDDRLVYSLKDVTEMLGRDVLFLILGALLVFRNRDSKAIFEGRAKIFHVGKACQHGDFFLGIIPGDKQFASIVKAQFYKRFLGRLSKMPTKKISEVHFAYKASIRKICNTQGRIFIARLQQLDSGTNDIRDDGQMPIVCALESFKNAV